MFLSKTSLRAWGLVAVAFAIVSTLSLVPRIACSAKTSSSPPEGIQSESDVKVWTEKLIERNWTRDAALAVISLNESWLAMQYEADRAYGDTCLEAWADLGQFPEIMHTLERFPHTAGLFVSAVRHHDVDMRKNLVDIFRGASADERQSVENLFMLYCDPVDAGTLAAMLVEHRTLLAQLGGHGFFGQEAVFMRPLKRQGDREFVAWAAGELSTALGQDPGRAADVLEFLHQQGPVLLERFRDDEMFVQQFRAVYWPLLCRIARDTPDIHVEDYACVSGIWDFLRRERAEALLRRCGVMAVLFLEGGDQFLEGGHRRFDPYPLELQDKVERLLLQADDDVLEALCKFRDHALFLKMLSRNLDENTLHSALSSLVNMPDHTVQDRIAYWNNLTENVLAEELGPPPEGPVTWLPFYYTVCVIGKKWDGREIGTIDLISAVADPAFLLMDIASFGGTVAGRTAGQKGLTTLLKQGTRQAADKLIAEGGEQAVRAFTRGTLRKTARELGEGLTKKLPFDITDLVRATFRTTGAGRESFKRFTGLEARLFMRADARVVIVPRALLLGGTTTELVNFVAVDAGLGLGLGAAIDNPAGEAVVGATVEGVAAGRESVKETAAAWQRHASAWWMTNALLPME